MNADGSGARRLTKTPVEYERPAWSPDGTKLFAADETRSTVTVVTVDGSAPNVRISHPRGQGLPVWQRLAP